MEADKTILDWVSSKATNAREQRICFSSKLISVKKSDQRMEFGFLNGSKTTLLAGMQTHDL
jgi:hypothetical protein